MVEKAVLSEVKENGVVKYFRLEVELPQILAQRLLEIQKINDISLTSLVNTSINFFYEVINIARKDHVAFLRMKATKNTSVDPEFFYIPHSELTRGKPIKLAVNIHVNNANKLQTLVTKTDYDITSLILFAINLAYKCEDYEFDGTNLLGRPRTGFTLATTPSDNFYEFARIYWIGKPVYC